ncbi:MAG: hypothetical protein L6R45_36930, partial [Anaerolineae bacterium]|nr:hypothetical protein [Anaerolineae bacterium]
SQWKRRLLEQGATIFDNGAVQQHQRKMAQREAQLYEQMGGSRWKWNGKKKYPAQLRPNGC